MDNPLDRFLAMSYSREDVLRTANKDAEIRKRIIARHPGVENVGLDADDANGLAVAQMRQLLNQNNVDHAQAIRRLENRLSQVMASRDELRRQLEAMQQVAKDAERQLESISPEAIEYDKMIATIRAGLPSPDIASRVVQALHGRAIKSFERTTKWWGAQIERLFESYVSRLTRGARAATSTSNSDEAGGDSSCDDIGSQRAWRVTTNNWPIAANYMTENPKPA